MSNQYGYTNLLTQEEVNKTISIIDSLSDKWIKRGPDNSRHSFYTLGSVSHFEIPPEDERITPERMDFINKNNEILSNNFKYLYDIVLKKVTDLFGNCEFVDGVPLPGFYIFGDIDCNDIASASPYGDVGGDATIHRDGLLKHLNYKWDTLGGATDSFAITLAIELPKNGAGILIWDQPDIGLYSDSEYAKHHKSLDFTANKHNAEVLKAGVKNIVPEVIDYYPGGIFWHYCGIYHAVGYSYKTLTTDRRITMQIFGVKCDGVWRLTF